MTPNLSRNLKNSNTSNDPNNFKIFAGNTNKELAKQVCELMGVPFGKSQVNSFSDGEIQVEIKESVRGKHVFVIQSTCPPVNQSYMELFIILDALKRASSASVTAVIPYYGYARQDRKVAPRAPISAKCMADLLTTAGADRVVSIDLHAAQIQGFFNCPFDHLFAIPTLAKSWKEQFGEGEQFVTVSPDAGGVERARAFAKRINSSLAIIDKRRSGPNEAKAMHLIGDVSGKIAVIVDDMIDTAGTLTQAVDSLLKNGAKQVFAIATHAVFSGPAIQRLTDSPIEKVFVTDTIPLSEKALNSQKIQVISVAPVLAEAIRRIHDHDSVSSLFD
jgi:ribose-phosphate pyrophosphokinase